MESRCMGRVQRHMRNSGMLYFVCGMEGGMEVERRGGREGGREG